MGAMAAAMPPPSSSWRGGAAYSGWKPSGAWRVCSASTTLMRRGSKAKVCTVPCSCLRTLSLKSSVSARVIVSDLAMTTTRGTSSCSLPTQAKGAGGRERGEGREGARAAVGATGET